MIGRRVAHLPYFHRLQKHLFLSLQYCFVYNIGKHIQHVYTWMYTHQFEHQMATTVQENDIEGKCM